MAEPRTSRVTSGNGPFDRLKPMNHAVRRTTTSPISDPPAESSMPNRDFRARRHTLPPRSHPRASPMPARAKKLPRAITDCRNRSWASCAKRGARTAPSTRPASNPVYVKSCRSAPRRYPVYAAMSASAMMTTSRRSTAGYRRMGSRKGDAGGSGTLRGEMVTLAHISDPHVGSPMFVPNLMNRVIVELNEMEPDAVICTGDLTNEGYRQEFKNWLAYASRIEAPIYTIP